MKLATLINGTPDGRLVIVSRDLRRATNAAPFADTLQEALEKWGSLEPHLRNKFDLLESGYCPEAFDLQISMLLAPLPRAWQWLDGSAFDSHGALMEKVFNLAPIDKSRPLMYQGISDRFYSAYEDQPFPSTEDGIDFEGEFGVILDETPLGVSSACAAGHIRLLVQINDWSLRAIAPIEMKTGFGWVQAKPPCSMAPVAITPDELGAQWTDCRLQIPLHVTWNGRHFGSPHGGAMTFGFDELIQHAARTRSLVAGTIIGSGTVSNSNFREVGSACIAERRGIELLDKGKAITPFMKFGDTVRMEALAADGSSLFGAIEQRVVPSLGELLKP